MMNKKNFDNSMIEKTAQGVTSEDLKLINKFTLKELKAEDVSAKQEFPTICGALRSKSAEYSKLGLKLRTDKLPLTANNSIV